MEKWDSVCIYCGEPLSKWERTRSYCWKCNELATAEAYNEVQEEVNEDQEEVYVDDCDENNWFEVIFQ